MRLIRAAMIVAATMFAAACASSSGPRTPSTTSDVITAEEIEASGATNAYELVSKLRPRWLQPARTTSRISGGVVQQPVTLVYLDGSRIGGIEALRGITVFGIRQARWYDADRAQTLLRNVPNDPINGAIVLTTRTQ